MTLQSPGRTRIRTDDDLMTMWQNLMGPGGIARRSLWIIFLEDDGRPNPLVVPIDDLPDEPDLVFTENLGLLLEDTAQPPIRSAAMLLSRPGRGGMHAGDRSWARALRRAVRPSLMPWPMHLATADRIQVFAPDDLVAD